MVAWELTAAQARTLFSSTCHEQPAAAVIGVCIEARDRAVLEGTLRHCTRPPFAMDRLRSMGMETGGPASFSASDQHAFARQLDRELAGQKPRT